MQEAATLQSSVSAAGLKSVSWPQAHHGLYMPLHPLQAARVHLRAVQVHDMGQAIFGSSQAAAQKVCQLGSSSPSGSLHKHSTRGWEAQCMPGRPAH